MAGIDATGFTPKTEDEIIAEITADLRANLDPNLNTTADSVAGQIIAVIANKVAENWEVLEGVYASQYPATADDASLDNVCSLTGTVRRAATFSTVTLTLNLDAGTTVPAGSIVAQSGNETNRFLTDVEITNGTGITDDFSVTATAEVSGPVSANSGTLTVIVTPISGWNTATNADAVPGLDVETDADLRLRRQQEIQRSGGSTVDAIEADISPIDGVISVIVTENTTLVTDGDGRPGKSFEALIWDGSTLAADDDEIAQAIYDNKPAGILSYSATADSGNATRVDGSTQVVEFSRATETVIHVACTVSTDATYGGDTAVKEAVAAIDYLPGEDVIYTRIYAAIYSVQGVTDVTTLTVDTIDPPVGTSNIAIGVRNVATIDTTNVDVTS